MSVTLALELHRIGALKFGEFRLKSGVLSPFYVDFRLLVSAPDVLELAADSLATLTRDLTYERIAAIPYAALPIGVALSLHTRKPMLYTRKERKEYGTANLIEGLFKPGERALLVDDVITRGDSKIEAMQPLQDAGLVITDIAVLLDRQGGGVEVLTGRDYRVHAVLTMTSLIDSLQNAGRITATQRSSVLTWLRDQAGTP